MDTWWCSVSYTDRAQSLGAHMNYARNPDTGLIAHFGPFDSEDAAAQWWQGVLAMARRWPGAPSNPDWVLAYLEADIVKRKPYIWDPEYMGSTVIKSLVLALHAQGQAD